MVVACLDANLALMSDGSVWEWNSQVAFRLNPTATTAPVQVSMLSGIKAIGTGYEHCLAVGKDGTVWAWGANDWGQLGEGTTVQNRETPVPAAVLDSVVSATGGGNSSIALRNDGTIWTWGWNLLGLENILAAPVHVVIPGSPDLVIAMNHRGDFVVGGQGAYTLTLTNIGQTATAGTITATDTLPKGLAYVSGAGSGWACSADGQTVTCTNPGPFEPRASSSIAVTVGESPVA